MSNVESSLASQLLPMATNTQQAETLNRTASANKADYPKPLSTERAGINRQLDDTINTAADDERAVRTGQQRREDFRDVLDRRMAEKPDRPEKTEGQREKTVSKDTGRKQQESTEAAAAAVSHNLHAEVSNQMRSRRIDPKQLAQAIARQKPKVSQADPKQTAAMASFKNAGEKTAGAKQSSEVPREMTEKVAAFKQKMAETEKEATSTQGKGPLADTDRTKAAGQIDTKQNKAQQQAAAVTVKNQSTETIPQHRQASPQQVQPKAQEVPVVMEETSSKENLSGKTFDKAENPEILQAFKQTRTHADNNSPVEKDQLGETLSAKVDQTRKFVEAQKKVMENAVDQQAQATSKAAIQPEITHTANASVNSTAASQPVSPANVQGPAGPQTAAQANIDPTQQVINEIRSTQMVPDREISLRLNPPELGMVYIRFQKNDGDVTGMIEVQRPQTRYDIEKSIPQVAAAMQSAGITVKRIQVVQQQQNNQDQGKFSHSEPEMDFSNQRFSAESGVGQQSGRDQEQTMQSGDSRNLNAREVKEVQDQITDDSLNVYI